MSPGGRRWLTWPLWAAFAPLACLANVPFGAATSGSSGPTDGATDGNKAPAQAQQSNVVVGGSATQTGPIDLGNNVIVLDGNAQMQVAQLKLDVLYAAQQSASSAQFGSGRAAVLLKPGNYNLNLQLGYYTQVLGLGALPDDVALQGNLSAPPTLSNDNATCNFWRSVENFAIGGAATPVSWSVAQGTWMRRLHVQGNVTLSVNTGFSSGGFLADTLVDGTIQSGTQQQFLSRNVTMGGWSGSNWNMMFLGCAGAPADSWMDLGYTNVAQTPRIREKPYLTLDANGAYAVRVPALKAASRGHSWGSASNSDGSTSLQHFYVAHAGVDSATTLNRALAQGFHLLLTPGIYPLDAPLAVQNPNTIVLGLGYATLQATRGNAAVEISDVAGVTLAGLLVDAGPQNSNALVVVGSAGSSARYVDNPTLLADISCRVGGAAAARADTCLVVHTADVLLDEVWLWRADHGTGVGWSENPANFGVVVNGGNVAAYGLFVEHFQNYQTVWNGEAGSTYFYQSELPYDPPNQQSYQHDGINGFASYKVAAKVRSHLATGLGVYAFFTGNIVEQVCYEAPVVAGVQLQHLMSAAPGNGSIEALRAGQPGTETGTVRRLQ